jgi:HEAT repeat protein/DNA-binding NarL/FixJ family response regulator
MGDLLLGSWGYSFKGALMAKKKASDFTKMSTLLVCADTDTRHHVRQVMVSIGCGDVTSASSHTIGQTRIKSRKFDLIVYEAKDSTIPAKQFALEALQRCPGSLLLALSHEPRIDDVFGLLRCGTHGFIVLPLSGDSLEREIIRARSGSPLNRSILDAPDRNTAFSNMIITQLDRVAALMRQARKYDTAKRELHNKRAVLEESVFLSKLFSEGGEDVLMEYLREEFAKRANRPASRLGRTRKRLDMQRGEKVSAENKEGAEEGDISKRILRVKTLEELGDDKRIAIGHLKTELLSLSQKSRNNSLKHIARLKIAELIPGVTSLLDDKEESIRCNAAGALAVFGLKAKGSKAKLQEALEDQAFMVRRNAVVALGMIGPEAADSAEEVCLLLGDWHKDVRISAIETLGNFGSAASEHVSKIVEVLEDEDPAVRKAGAATLGLIRSKDAVPHLSKILADDEPEVREAVSKALRRIGTPGALNAIRKRDKEESLWNDRRT